MSSNEEKERQRREEEARRREEEARRRDEDAEKLRRQIREKYEEGARQARKASQEGADIAKRAAEEGADLGEEQARRAYEDAQRRIKLTYLHLPDEHESLTTIASPPPRVYYVIVGCGTAAVVNHTTLRQTTWGMKRIRDFPVMHIGFDDPWSHYISHGMGQPPYLLTMPGYHKRPSQDDDVFEKNPGCNSASFAACTKHEWDELWKKYHKDDQRLDKFAWKEAFLVWIESEDKHPAKAEIKRKLKDEGLDLDIEKVKPENKLVAGLDENYVRKIPRARYRLLIVVPQSETSVLLEYVYAWKIDICVGPGRPRIPDGPAWKEGRTKLWTPPRMWGAPTVNRKFVNGPEAFYTETIWSSTDRVYINGGGGIGLNMVERAEIVSCFADWAPTGTLHATFNLPRNDIVLKALNKNINTVGQGGLAEFFVALTRDDKAETILVPWFAQERGLKAFTKEDLKDRISRKRAAVEGTGEVGLFRRIEPINVDVLFELLSPADRNPLFHGGQLKPGESGVRVKPFMAPTNNKVVLTPFFDKWRFGGGSEPSIVRVDADKVIIKIAGAKNRNNPSAPPATPFIRDCYYQNQGVNDKGAFPLSPSYKQAFPVIAQLNESDGAVYSRICLTTGIVMAGEMGTSEAFAKAFTFDPLPGPSDGRTVGLEADNGRIRILGAAAQAHPSDKFKIAKPGQVEPEEDAASKFFFSLPMSAVVPGFIFSGVNIAEANHYFAEHPNVNVNTMTVSELKRAVPEEKIALAVGKYRRLSNGYGTPEDLANALKGDTTVTSVSGWQDVIGKLETNYSPAGDFLDNW